jgi:hypothetical protein
VDSEPLASKYSPHLPTVAVDRWQDLGASGIGKTICRRNMQTARFIINRLMPFWLVVFGSVA